MKEKNISDSLQSFHRIAKSVFRISSSNFEFTGCAVLASGILGILLSMENNPVVSYTGMIFAGLAALISVYNFCLFIVSKHGKKSRNKSDSRYEEDKDDENIVYDTENDTIANTKGF